MPPRQKSLNEAKGPSIHKGQKSPQENNQKKSLTNVHRKPIYKTEFQKKIIIQLDSNGDKFYCDICPDKPQLLRKNVDNHCLNSLVHQNHIKKEHEKNHEDLLKEIRNVKTKNKIIGKNLNGGEKDENIRDYLEFLTFCFKENLSFLQISALGKFLQNLMETNKINFLKIFNFELEGIGKAAKSIGEAILEEITENLCSNPYSLSMDNVTVSGDSICGLQVRYLKEYTDCDGLKRYAIQNKVIGLKYLEESSNSKALLSPLNEKVFNLQESLEQNLIGITHDRASAFTGEENGLDALLQKRKGSFLFTLKDPCHSLNLVLSKSLSLLPKEVQFIESISQHFSSSQREARLLKIQREKGLKVLGNKPYIKTRWLSFGESLTRILEIWESLELYMKEKPHYAGISKEKYDDWLSLLQDKEHKLKILCLSGIINKRLNKINIKWQNQSLEIQNLKLEMNQCLKDISCLFLNPEKIPEEVTEMKLKQWDKEENFQDFILPHDIFIQTIIREIDPNLKDILLLEEEKQQKFAEVLKKFLSKVLSLLVHYLPVGDKTIDSLDFVTLVHPLPILKEKILNINNTFAIISSEQIPDLVDEINSLKSKEKLWMRVVCKESSLHLWDLIQGVSLSEDGNSKYPLLSKVFRIAHSLPTSSSGIEQVFSSLKLVKSNLRNRLNENTVQSLILILQKFNDEEIIISDKMVENYKHVRDALNVRKSRSRLLNAKVFEENRKEDDREEEKNDKIVHKEQETITSQDNEKYSSLNDQNGREGTLLKREYVKLLCEEEKEDLLHDKIEQEKFNHQKNKFIKRKFNEFSVLENDSQKKLKVNEDNVQPSSLQLSQEKIPINIRK